MKKNISYPELNQKKVPTLANDSCGTILLRTMLACMLGTRGYRANMGHEINAALLTTACFLVGMWANVKFEITTKSGTPLSDDIHELVMSPTKKLFLEDVNTKYICCCADTTDMIVVIASTILVAMSTYYKSPHREYMMIPWLGITLRGLLASQTITAVATLFVTFMAEQKANLVTAGLFLLLFYCEVRLITQVASNMYNNWQKWRLQHERDLIRLGLKKMSDNSTIDNNNSEELYTYTFAN